MRHDVTFTLYVEVARLAPVTQLANDTVIDRESVSITLCFYVPAYI